MSTIKKNKRDIEHQIAMKSFRKGREVVEVTTGKYKGCLGEICDANDYKVLVRLLRSNEEIELDAEYIQSYKVG